MNITEFYYSIFRMILREFLVLLKACTHLWKEITLFSLLHSFLIFLQCGTIQDIVVKVVIYVLTYFSWRNNPYNRIWAAFRTSFHDSRFLAFSLQFRRPSCLMSCSTSSIHRRLGLPCFRLPSGGGPREIRFCGAFSSIRSTWPNQRNLCTLIFFTMSMSAYSWYSSWLYRILHSPPRHTGPKILRRIFLSKHPKIVSSLVSMVHDSEPYIRIGSMRVLYSAILVFRDIILDLIVWLKLK